MKSLKDASSAMFARAREHRERPEMLESLRQAINSSTVFLEKSRSYTGEGGLFKEKELDALQKKIVDVEKWRDEKVFNFFKFENLILTSFGSFLQGLFVRKFWHRCC